MKKILFLFVALAAAGYSCSKEKGPGIVSDEKEVEMSFLLPGSATRALADDENEIKNLTLLVFDGDGDNAKYLYGRYTWKKTSGVNTYGTTLKTGSGFTIYFAVNWENIIEYLEGNGIDENSTWAEVRELLVFDTPDNIDLTGKGLPMWGRVTNRSITDGASNHLGTIPLIRAVASVDIYMVATNFTMEEGHIAYAANTGYLAYDPAKTAIRENILRATSPYCPSGYNTGIDLHYTVQAGDDEITGQFYIYDNDTPLKDNLTANNTTKVVLGGIWNDPEGCGTTTYYPLTLRNWDDDEDDYVKQQVTRNNKYSIFVTNVNGDGYDDYEDAKDADDVNWEYDVVPWDGNQDGGVIIDGTKYLYHSTNAVTIYRPEGSTGEIYFKTNYQIEDIKMKFSTDPDFPDPTVRSIENGRFKVEIIEDSRNCFKVTAKKEYGEDSENPSTMNVLVGRIPLNVVITQVNAHPNDWNAGGWIDAKPGQ